MIDDRGRPPDDPPAQGWATSATLLGKLRDGRPDGPAWARFVAKYRPLIVRSYRGRGVQESDAEDLAQDALLALAKALPGFEYDPRRRFRGFVGRVLAAVLHDSYRYRGRHPGGFARGGDPVDGDELDPRAPDPPADAIAEALERDHLIGLAADRVLADFAPVEAAAVRLLVFEERAASSIARELGIEQGKIYRLGARFEKRLGEYLRANHPDLCCD